MTETVHPTGESYRRTAQLYFRIPAVESGARLLLPLMVVRRGELIDNLRVVDHAGDLVPLLSHEEHEQLAVEALTARMIELMRDRPSQVSRSELRLVMRALTQVVKAEDLADRRAAFNQLKAGKSWLHSVVGSDTLFMEFARMVLRGYLVIADLPADVGEARVLTLEYEAPARDTFGLRRSRLRRLLGHSPYTFQIPIPWAVQTPSYQFRMRAPDGHYLRGNRLFECDNGTCVELDTSSESVALVAGETRQGTPYAHMYVSGLDPADSAVRHYARVQFSEIPFGSQGATAVLAAAVLLLLVWVGLRLTPLIQDDGSAVELGSALLGVPALIYAFLRPTYHRTDVVSAPLTARIGAVATLGAAFVAAIWLFLTRAVYGTAVAAGESLVGWTAPGLVWRVIVITQAVVLVVVTAKMIRGYGVYRKATRQFASA